MPEVFGTAGFCEALRGAVRPEGVVATQMFPDDKAGKAFRRLCGARSAASSLDLNTTSTLIFLLYLTCTLTLPPAPDQVRLFVSLRPPQAAAGGAVVVRPMAPPTPDQQRSI